MKYAFIKTLVCTGLVGLLFTGCTNTEKGAGAGAALGAIAGGVIGHNQNRHGGEGALIGAAGGALIGGLIGHQMDKKEAEETASTTTYSSAPPATAPAGTYPYGIKCSKTGYVKSPYAPDGPLVDVRGFPSGSQVQDPITGKIFLVP